MGQGGYINLKNNTPFEWKRTYVHSYQMDSWDNSFPESLKPGKQKRCYVEFNQDIFKTTSDDAGEVTYTLGDTSKSFQIQARAKDGFLLQVDWKNTPTQGFFVFPPPTDQPGHIGWIHDGTLSLAVGHLPNRAPQPTASSQTWESWLPQWMELYDPVLRNLTLRDLTIPGTHDSGTYDMLNPLGQPWTQTQDMNLEKQLNWGVRSLDLRSGFQPDKSGDDKFILVHDTWSTKVSMTDALKQVLQFCRSNSREIIVLDFHRFVALSGDDFDYNGLIDLIKLNLDGHIIPPENIGKSLSDIWKNSNQRIVVAFNSSESDPMFWPGVEQKWAGSDVTTKDALKKYFENVLSGPLPSGLSSLEAVLPPSIHSPLSVPLLSPTISNWFYGGAQWSKQANIVATDWVEKTALVSAAVCSSFLKGCSQDT